MKQNSNSILTVSTSRLLFLRRDCTFFGWTLTSSLYNWRFLQFPSVVRGGLHHVWLPYDPDDLSVDPRELSGGGPELTAWISLPLLLLDDEVLERAVYLVLFLLPILLTPDEGVVPLLNDGFRLLSFRRPRRLLLSSWWYYWRSFLVPTPVCQFCRYKKLLLRILVKLATFLTFDSVISFSVH